MSTFNITNASIFWTNDLKIVDTALTNSINEEVSQYILKNYTVNITTPSENGHGNTSRDSTNSSAESGIINGTLIVNPPT